MKYPNLVILALVFLTTIIIPVYAQYTEQVSDPSLARHHPRQIPMDKLKLVQEFNDLSIEKEKSTTFHANFTLAKNYEINSIFPYVQNLPEGVIAQVAPSDLSSFNMDGRSANVTITLYANHDAKPGKYLLDVMALGYIQNIDNAKLVPTKDRVLGKIDLTIQENKKSLSVDVGEPIFHHQNFCDKPDQGQICQGTGFVEYPITIFSDKPSQVTLAVSEHSPDVWAKLVPNKLEALPNGTRAKLVAAGYQSTYSTPMPDKDVWSITMQSENDQAVDFFEYARSPQISILQSAQPISTYDSAYAKTTGTGITTFGAVYEPGDKSTKPISVFLSYMGIAKGNEIEKPDWLQVEFPSSPFVLNPSEPYFFPVKVTTDHAKSGPHWMIINQIIDDKQFVQRLNLSVYDSLEVFDWDKFTGKGWWDRFVQSYELGPPISQLKFGIEMEEIQCEKGLVLALRATNGNPSCVTPDSLKKLMERGWTTSALVKNAETPLYTRLANAQNIVEQSFGKLPITGVGIYMNKELEIMIHEDELKKNQNAEQYYKKLFQDMLPFDVPIKITFSHAIPLFESQKSDLSSYNAKLHLPNVTDIIIPLGSHNPELKKNYEPNTVTVVIGVNNTIQWIQQDDVPSTVVSDQPYDGLGFRSTHLRQNDSFIHTFTKAGTYEYHSEPHPWKKGIIIVREK